jgi:hypothetical protein
MFPLQSAFQASVCFVLVLSTFMGGIVIFRAKSRPRSFFSRSANVRSVFGSDMSAYVPVKIEARYRMLLKRIAEQSGCPEQDIQRLQAFCVDAWSVFLAASERAADIYNAKCSPMPASSGWRQVLGLNEGVRDETAVKRAYRRRMAEVHPDRGGMPELSWPVTAAYRAAKAELDFA